MEVVNVRATTSYNRLRLALTGPTGSGKSTAASLIDKVVRSKGLTCERLRLAEPLYELQSAFYTVAQRPIDRYEQDQVLLEAIADHLRRISPTSLVDDFERRLASTSSDVVINEDLRDAAIDGPRLQSCGFAIVRVRCGEALRRDRLVRRSDLTVVADSSTTQHIDEITPGWVLDNDFDDVARLELQVRSMLKSIL